jgi:Replication-relaxation
MGMRAPRGVSLTGGALAGLYFIQKYRFLTITQFARIAGFSNYHAGEILRNLEARNVVGFFGFTTIRGHGKTPKVYYLKRKGWELLQTDSEYPPERIGPFMEVSREFGWTPQMYHRLRLLDLFVALEVAVRQRPHLELIQTLIEYRRLRGTYVRETTDFVAGTDTPENRIIPDGAFVLENMETGRRGLFFVEMDMGTERITAQGSRMRFRTLT